MYQVLRTFPALIPIKAQGIASRLEIYVRSRPLRRLRRFLLSVVVSDEAQQGDDENGQFPCQPFCQADVLIERHSSRLRSYKLLTIAT